MVVRSGRKKRDNGKDPPKISINKSNNGIVNKAVNTTQKKRKGNPVSINQIPKIRKSRSTESVADSIMHSDDDLGSQSDHSSSTIKDNKSNNSAKNKTKNQDKSENNNTKNKPIIIDLKNNSIIIMKQKLSDLKLTKNYTIKSLRDNKAQIQTQCKEDKNKILDYLRSNKESLSYHTFTEKDEKNSMYVLKNHHYLDLDQMLELLKSENVPATNVSFLNNSKTHPSYIVHFEKNSINLTMLKFQYKVIEHCIIKWEKFDSSKKKISQCHNCQLFGHTARNCGHKYRCVKCVENHLPGKCGRIDKTGNPKCVNCNGDHAANSKQCPKFVEYTEHLKKMKKPKVIIKRQDIPRKFSSTPAPWANFQLSQPDFPPLNQNTNINDRLDRLRNSNSNSNNINNIDEESTSFDNFTRIQEDFSNIPDIAETLKMFKSLVDKLKSTNCHKTRLSYLIEYTLK